MLHLREVSDLHLEMYYDLYDHGMGYAKAELLRLIPPLPTDKKTVLIVAGDLASARRPQRIKTFFEILRPRFKHFIYVLGNHEHYGSYMSESLQLIKDCLADSEVMKKITIAGNEPVKVKIGDVTFLCATMWTDYALGPSDSADLVLFKRDQYARIESHIARGKPEDAAFLTDFMVDFEKLSDLQAMQMIISRFITDHKRMLDDTGLGVTPAHLAFEVYKPTIAKFDEWLRGQDNSKTVMVTHHMPSFKAVALQYMLEPTTRMLNHAFASDLDDFITIHQPAYWFFGHTHIKYNGQIGRTILHCNPLGYPHEPTVENNLYDSTKVYSL